MRYRLDVRVKGMRAPSRLAAMAACFLLVVSSGCERYEQKDGKVYFRELSQDLLTAPVLIEQADPDTFRAIRHKYARDRRHVYYRGRLVTGAQPGFIRVLGGRYARDRGSVYCAGNRIEQADWRTFEVLDGVYGRDAHNIHVCTTTLEDVHLPSFRLLRHGHGKAMDRFAVYDGARRMEPCDRASFRELDAKWQLDGQCVYRYLERQPMIDAASFEVLGKRYVRDRLRVYTTDTIDGVVVVAGADPATFREVADAGRYGDVHGQDSKGCYAGRRRLACSALLAQP